MNDSDSDILKESCGISEYFISCIDSNLYIIIEIIKLKFYYLSQLIPHACVVKIFQYFSDNGHPNQLTKGCKLRIIQSFGQYMGNLIPVSF